MPTQLRRAARGPAPTRVAGGSHRPSARGSNSARAGDAASGGTGLDVFGAAAATQASAPPEWDAVVAGRSTLRIGSRGAAVEYLQQRLLESGQDVGVDGDFGPGTRRAVVAWQRGVGIDDDGVVGASSAARLGGAAGPSSAVAPAAPGDTRGRRDVAGRDIAPGMFEHTGLRAGVFAKALDAFSMAFAEGASESMVVTVIDYELPSSEKRFWVIDLERQRLLFHEYTSHGSGSDRNHDGRMDAASNVNGSGMSNVGLLRTAETYSGKHGRSLRLDGLERGFNDNARERAVVVHAADYVDDRFIARHGKAGRSLGCPALDPDVNGRVIDTIQGGKLVFAYYPDERWLQRSRYLSGGRG